MTNPLPSVKLDSGAPVQTYKLKRGGDDRFRYLIENGREAVLLINIEGIITYATPNLHRVLGFSAEEYVGRDAFQIVHPDDLRRARQIFESVISHPGKPETAVVRAQNKSGGWRWIEGTAQNLLRTPQIAAIVCNIRDVTAEKEAQQAVVENEARFQMVARATLDVIWDWDMAKDRLWWNSNYTSVFGYSQEEMPRTLARCQERCHPEDIARARQSLQKALEGNDPIWCEEFRYRRSDGSYANVYNRSYIMRDPAGRAARVLGAMMDISQLKATEAELNRSYERLRHAQKMESLGQLAGGVAHDFNNILTVIEGHADLLRRESRTPQTRESAEEIISAVIRASSLTRQLLTFSRKNVFHPTAVRLNDLVHGLGKMLRRIMGEHITLEISTPAESPVVRADPGMLEQVLMNLVINARDAMPEGGVLKIETSASKSPADQLDPIEGAARPDFGYALLRVVDTGIGIAPEHLDKIFEPFFTTKPTASGTGLGLATVYGIIKQHHGVVKFQSEPGAGTTFDVWIPLTEEIPTNQETVPRVPPAGGTETVLLVEDEPSLLMLASSILERFGYKVLTAISGVEALKIWEQESKQIQLLVTDLVLPGSISGHALGLNLHREHPSLGVVYTSGYSEEMEEDEQGTGHSARFLPKPYTPEQLLRIVRETLDAVPK